MVISEYVCHLSFKTWIEVVSGCNENTVVLVSTFRQFKSKMSLYLWDLFEKTKAFNII